MRTFWHRFLILLLTCYVVASAHSAPVNVTARQFRFGVLQQPADGSDVPLREAIVRANQKNLAFLVVNGIKSKNEPCSDTFYQQRKNLLNESEKAIVVSLAGSDWIECKSEEGKPLAVERLQRLRELYFDGGTTLGAKKMRLVRQSLTAKFRSFSENGYWRQGKILFATVNLPAANNHYLAAAGRNSEFEDRLIANRDWLQRIFSLARIHKMRGIVLFADGNPIAKPARRSDGSRDGFLEVRKQIMLLTARFPGRVLLVHGHAPTSNAQIAWRDNLGTIGAGKDWLEITANPAAMQVFSASHARHVKTSASKKNQHK